MKKNLQIISSAIVMTLFFTFPAFAGQWIQDAGRPAVSDGVSNWRWQEDDGTYVQDCDLWLETRTGFMKTTILTPAAGCLPPHRMAMAKLLIPTALS